MDILAFFAHPDDETMLCGGTLALLSSLGARVHLLIATRGEGGENGEPEVCPREQLGQVRENELRCAAQALGAASLTVMDYIDPTVGPDNQLFPFTDNIESLAAELVEAIRLRKASVLLVHGVNGEYGHPAHKLAHQAACLAVQILDKEAPLFYTVQAAFAAHPYPRLANVDTPAHLVLDITLALSRKTEAALCHRTQHALFIRHHSQEAGRTVSVPEVIMRLESLHRVLPQANGAGPIHDPLADLLWSSGFASLPTAG
jgi:N-acetylglucosamine malate deacetylase 2